MQGKQHLYIIVHVLQKKIVVPWVVIAYEIRNIRDLLQQMEFSVQQTFREANRAVDFLANLGVMKKKFLLFS